MQPHAHTPFDEERTVAERSNLIFDGIFQEMRGLTDMTHSTGDETAPFIHVTSVISACLITDSSDSVYACFGLTRTLKS